MASSSSSTSGQLPLPLPPGVMPSESRQNIVDILSRTKTSKHNYDILKEGMLGEVVERQRVEEGQIEREPAATPSKAWQPADEGEEEHPLSPLASTAATYHIDLDENTRSRDSGGSGSTDTGVATMSVKLVDASEDDLEQERKQLFSLFAAGMRKDTATPVRTPWRGMTPLRRYNKVAPSPQKSTTKTPTAVRHTAGKENHLLQVHSESSLLDDKQPLRAERSLAASENRRPESAPSYSPRRTKNCTTHSTGDTMLIKVEPRPATAAAAVCQDDVSIAPSVFTSDSSDSDPVYSKVMKVKHTHHHESHHHHHQQQDHQQQQHENDYSEPVISLLSSPLSTVVTKLDFSAATTTDSNHTHIGTGHTHNGPSHISTGDIVHMMSAAAAQDDIMSNDSLYDSFRQPRDDGDNEATDDPYFNPAFYKGLQRHEQEGNIHLIAVRGMADLPDNTNVNYSHGGSPGMLPIHYAAGSGNKKVLKELLALLPLRQDPVERVIGSRRLCWREGVDVPDEEKRTPLMHAVHGNHVDCVAMLVDAGANINTTAADGSTPLHDAAYVGSSQMVALLLSLGCNGMLLDTEGRNALHWATHNRDPQCIELLLDKVPGLHVDVRDKAGMTPLMWAAYNGRPDNVQTLRQKGADSSLVDIDGLRAVHWSVQRHEYSALSVLISPESSQSRDTRGKTVMHQAAEQGCAKAIELIAAVRPSSVNDQDLNSRTPLHWAAVCENPEAVRALLANGADPDIRDSSDRTPLDYAQERGLHYISLLLSQSMNMGADNTTDYGGRYHHVLSFGEVDSIGVRTLLQQEGRSLCRGEVTMEHLTEEQLVHVKSINTGAWINKFTCEGKGPLHPRFFWIDPVTMRVHWSKSIESRYIHSKETKSDTLVGVRSSASPSILHRKDFDPMGKHKFAFSLFTSSRVLNLVALSSEDFKTWLNGLQLLLYLGSDQAAKIVNGVR